MRWKLRDMAVNFWPSLKYSVIEILLVKVADNLSSCVLAAVLANSRQFLASKQFSGRNRWPRRSGSLLLIFPFCYPEVVLSPAVVAWACLFLRSKGPETRRKGPGTHSADGFELSHPRGKDANDSGCFGSPAFTYVRSKSIALQPHGKKLRKKRSK